MGNIDSKLISGFGWFTSTKLIVQVASWASTIWVARILTPDDYGLVAISGIFVGFCLTISSLGLGSALINKQDLSPAEIASVFWVNLAMAVSVYGILFLIAPYVAVWYEDQRLTEVIRVAALMVVASPLGLVPRAMVTRELKFRTIALIGMASNAVVIGSTIVLAISGFGYWSLIISTVAGEFCYPILYMIVARYVPGRPSSPLQHRWLFTYGMNILSSRIVAYGNNYSSTIIGSNIFSVPEMGELRLAGTLAGLPMRKIGEIFGQIGFPAFSRLQSDTEKARSVFLGMHQLLLAMTVPMFVGIALISEDLVPLVLGAKWSGIAHLLQIFCLINVITASAMLMPQILEGLGNARASLKYRLIVLATTPPGMLIGAYWGLEGMLIGHVLTAPIGYSFLLRQLSSSLDLSLRELLRTNFPTLMSASVMIVGVLAVDGIAESAGMGLLQRFTLQIAVGATTYVSCYMILGASSIRSMRLFMRGATQ